MVVQLSQVRDVWTMVVDRWMEEVERKNGWAAE